MPHVLRCPCRTSTSDDFVVVRCSLEVWQGLYVGVELAIADFTSGILLVVHWKCRSLPHCCSPAGVNTSRCWHLWIGDNLVTLTRWIVLVKWLKHCKQTSNQSFDPFSLLTEYHKQSNYLLQRLLYFKPDCTHTVDLLMTVTALVLALHLLLFVPPCLFPLSICINICVLLFV